MANVMNRIDPVFGHLGNHAVRGLPVIKQWFADA